MQSETNSKYHEPDAVTVLAAAVVVTDSVHDWDSAVVHVAAAAMAANDRVHRRRRRSIRGWHSAGVR